MAWVIVLELRGVWALHREQAMMRRPRRLTCTSTPGIDWSVAVIGLSAFIIMSKRWLRLLICNYPRLVHWTRSQYHRHFLRTDVHQWRHHVLPQLPMKGWRFQMYIGPDGPINPGESSRLIPPPKTMKACCGFIYHCWMLGDAWLRSENISSRGSPSTIVRLLLRRWIIMEELPNLPHDSSRIRNRDQEVLVSASRLRKSTRVANP